MERIQAGEKEVANVRQQGRIKRLSIAGQNRHITLPCPHIISHQRGYREIKFRGIYKRLGLRQMPSVESIYQWRKMLSPIAHKLVKETFYLTYRRIGIKNLTVIADGSGVKKSRRTQYYEWRLETSKKKRRHRGCRKRGRRRRAHKKKFVRVVVSHVPEIDMIFTITATASSVGELRAFENGHLQDITSAKIFSRFIADKLYDSEELLKKAKKR